MGVWLRYPGSHTRSLHQVSEGIRISPTHKIFPPGFSTLKNKRPANFFAQVFKTPQRSPQENTKFPRRGTLPTLRDTQSYSELDTEEHRGQTIGYETDKHREPSTEPQRYTRHSLRLWCSRYLLPLLDLPTLGGPSHLSRRERTGKKYRRFCITCKRIYQYLCTTLIPTEVLREPL